MPSLNFNDATLRLLRALLFFLTEDSEDNEEKGN